VVLDDKSANQAADLAAKTGVRGMDALLTPLLHKDVVESTACPHQ